MPNPKPFLLFWGLITLSVLNSNLSAAPIIIKAANTYTFNESSWSFITTDQKSIPIALIADKYKTGAFKLVGQSVFNGGIPKQYYWFHFTVINSDSIDNEIIIDIENPRLNELELFEQDSIGIKSLGKTGDFFQFDQRKINYKNFVYTNKIKKGEAKDFFLFINQIGHTFILPIKIHKFQSFQSESLQNYCIDGLTYGILLFACLLSFLFFINTRHFLYLFYALYVLTAVVWLLSYFGLGYQYIWGKHPYISTLSSPLFASLNLIANIQICQNLLQLHKQQEGIIYKAGKMAKFFLLLIGCFPLAVNLNQKGYFFNHNYLIAFLSIIIFSVIIVFLSILFYSIKGSVVARFYMVSSILKILSIFNLALLELGITPGFYNMEGILQIGILIEITLLSYAIAKRYTDYKLKSFNQVIKAQEIDRGNISREIHDCISNELTFIKIDLDNRLRDSANPAFTQNKELKKIRDAIRSVQERARNISHFMFPDYIETTTLSALVEEYINEKSSMYNCDKSNPLSINFQTNGNLFEFSKEIKLNIYRISQELVSNILKHAKATEAEFSFSFKERNLSITCEDNGVGIDTDIDMDRTDSVGIGLISIRSRVKHLNGAFNIQSFKLSEDKMGMELNQTDKSRTIIKINIPYWHNTSYNFNMDDF